MRLSASHFNAFLYRIGQRVLWRRSYACPCLNPSSGSPKPDCPKCSGVGFFHDPGVETVVGVASQKVQQNWAKMGLWESGDSVVSVPENSPAYDMGRNDRIVMLNGSDRFNQVMIRGRPQEKLRFVPKSLEKVFWFDVDGKTIINGTLPTVDATGKITFTPGTEPPTGRSYTLIGERYAEYYCFQNFPSDRNEHQGERLPKLVVLRLFDVANRSSVT